MRVKVLNPLISLPSEVGNYQCIEISQTPQSWLNLIKYQTNKQFFKTMTLITCKKTVA